MNVWLDVNGWRIMAGFLILCLLLVLCGTTVADKATGRRINTFGAILTFILSLLVIFIPGRALEDRSKKKGK